jgi:hypothetical protein
MTETTIKVFPSHNFLLAVMPAMYVEQENIFH